MSSCNLVANSGFESGSLAPWFPSAAGVAKITSGPTAYSGDYYLNLQTAVGNRGNTISQRLKGLEPHKNYTVTVHAQFPAPNLSNYCFVYVSAGHNSTKGFIASDTLFTTGEWTTLTGYHEPRHTEEVLNILAECDSEDSSVTGNVLFDDIVFSDC